MPQAYGATPSALSRREARLGSGGTPGLMSLSHDLDERGGQRWLFLVVMVAELLVPVVAERSQETPWHPHHIEERYGLFTPIVLGETSHPKGSHPDF